ncbi:MAG: NFACT RNA binding domain-containing protein [Leptolyngbyaceae bacterium]|nr:NFACT RNA binding domain-containing protein [Leptolyngbyaceae bacterium]
MQTVDVTTLYGLCAELRHHWVPARIEQVYQCDRHTLAMALRTLESRGWLSISWHPQAARICLTTPPPRIPDTFTFSQQLRHQLGGFALVAIQPLAAWERALDLQFAHRPGDPICWHVYVEIMGKYSNVVLTNDTGQIVTAAHQVGSQQSSVRSIQTGQAYTPPPPLTDAVPRLSESQADWQERVSLVPKALWKNLLQSYRGLSPALAKSMAIAAGLDPEQTTDQMSATQWSRLFQRWQEWLEAIATDTYTPTQLPKGYSVMPWGKGTVVSSLQTLVDEYYTDELNRQVFTQLRHQLGQKLNNLIKKLQQKVDGFQHRLQQSDQADQYRQQADLLMAYLHEWQPGFTHITLADFETDEPTTIALDPTKNAVQNAQALYKRHQKLKRSRQAITPLLKAALDELHYLQQVEGAIAQQDTYQTPTDLTLLQEIRQELIQQGYWPGETPRSTKQSSMPTFHRYVSPHGFEILVGRNNNQNDYLTFRVATDYDLWFHTQEIPGSHVLLRLPPGTVPDETDLQTTANVCAYYSRARQSDQVPVIYTQPKQVFKPKGSKPGMVIYKGETVIWGQPQQGKAYTDTTTIQNPTKPLQNEGN